MNRNTRRAALLGLSGLAVLALSPSAWAQERPIPYSDNELVGNGHRFFGSLSRGLAEAIQSATRRWGQPNAYVLGQEASGAFIGGLRYGEGTMYTRNAGDRRLFWQGPSIGFDAGADGDRTMMLVYNLTSTDGIFEQIRRRGRLGLSGRRLRHYRPEFLWRHRWFRSAPESAPVSASMSAI